MNIRTDL